MFGLWITVKSRHVNSPPLINASGTSTRTTCGSVDGHQKYIPMMVIGHWMQRKAPREVGPSDMKQCTSKHNKDSNIELRCTSMRKGLTYLLTILTTASFKTASFTTAVWSTVRSCTVSRSVTGRARRFRHVLVSGRFIHFFGPN